MARLEKFYLVLVGDDDKKGFSPGKIRGKELGEFLSLLDDLFSAVLSNQMGNDFGGLRVVGVSKGSLSVACQPVRGQAPVFADLANQIESGCMVKKVQPPVDKLRVFNTVWNTRLEFRRTKKGQPVATIHQLPKEKDVCTLPSVSMQTTTTLYGQITGISGVKKISVVLSLLGFPGGVRFEVGKKDIKKFCARFGQVVGVSGIADVQLPSREITHFVFKDFSPYQERPLTESIAELRDGIGQYFNIDDIDAIIREHRG